MIHLTFVVCLVGWLVVCTDGCCFCFSFRYQILFHYYLLPHLLGYGTKKTQKMLSSGYWVLLYLMWEGSLGAWRCNSRLVFEIFVWFHQYTNTRLHRVEHTHTHLYYYILPINSQWFVVVVFFFVNIFVAVAVVVIVSFTHEHKHFLVTTTWTENRKMFPIFTKDLLRQKKHD